MIKSAFILLGAGALILGAFAIHPGLGILIAVLSYGAIDGLLGR